MKKKKVMRLFAGMLAITILSPSGAITVSAEETVQNETAEKEGYESTKDDNLTDTKTEAEAASETAKENTEAEAAVEAEKEEGARAAEQKETVKIKYLSDLEEVYEKVGHGTLGKDKNTEMKEGGSGLQVQIPGEKVTFPKGIFAHASSTIIYDTNEFKDQYPNFSAFLGVDTRTGGGNGVKFHIYVSDKKDDNNAWEKIYESGVVETAEAKYVNLPMNGKRYIKLEADSNGANGQDHVVYANAGFVTADYKLTDGYDAPIKQVEQYDEELQKINYKDENEIDQNTQKIYQREFVNQAGFYTINHVYDMKDENGNYLYREAIEYLMTDTEALYYYINGGPKPSGGTYDNSLIAFGKLYREYKDELEDPGENHFNIRLAVSVAAAYANPAAVRFWTGNDNPNSNAPAVQQEDPVRRYATYKRMSEEGGYMDQISDLAQEPTRRLTHAQWSGRQFRELNVPMMRWVVDSRMHEDEFDWLAQYIMNWARKEENQTKNFLDSYMYVHNKKKDWQYTDPKYYSAENRAMWNETYQFDDIESFDEDAKYGEDVIRSWIVWEEGGVCGAYAKTYANLAEVSGRPSIVTGQPAHAAALTWQWVSGSGSDGKGQYEWAIQNNAWSLRETSSEFNDYMLGWGTRRKLGDIDTNRNRASSYTLLATDVLQDWEGYVRAKRCILLANSMTEFNVKKELHYKALNISPRFLDATYMMLDAYLNKPDVTSAELMMFMKETASRYMYYPMVMADLMREFELSGKMTDPVHLAELYMERQRSLEEAYTLRKPNRDLTAKDYEKTRQPWFAGDVARAILERDHSKIASFSFDGENGGKIILTPKLQEKGLTMKYSLDGGVSWKTAAGNEAVLTTEELNSITDENDIQVTVEGVTENMYGWLPVCEIDIVKQNTPDAVEANDYEDLLLGNTANLEYSEDGGKTWKEYEQNGLKNKIRFDGDRTILARYRSHGQTLAGEAAQFIFQNAADTAAEQYLPLQYVTLHEFSSQQNDGNQAAKNLIDGQSSTGWHSKWDTVDKKEYSVKFDKARRISKLEYTPNAGGANGRWAEVEVYGSGDGKTWTKISETVTLENNADTKEIKVNSDQAWQYMKVKGNHSYSHDGNADKYFSGSMLNFFEDTTK